MNRTWTRTNYEVRNDSVYGTSKHSSNKGYSVTVSPLNSNQTEPAVRLSYVKDFGLVSKTTHEFNSMGLPTKRVMWKNLEYTRSQFDKDEIIQKSILRNNVATFYTYEFFDRKLLNR